MKRIPLFVALIGSLLVIGELGYLGGRYDQAHHDALIIAQARHNEISCEATLKNAEQVVHTTQNGSLNFSSVSGSVVVSK